MKLRITIFLMAILYPLTTFSSAMTKESAYQIAEAYQMEGVSDAVHGMVVDEVRRELAGRVKEWTVEVFSELRSDARSSMLDPRFQRVEKKWKKEEIKKRLKGKLKKYLPKIAKKVLYEKLFLGEFGDEVEEVKKIVNRVVDELKMTFNERADQFVNKWYDKAIQEIDEYLKFQKGPISVDLTNVRGTLDKAIQLSNIEWGLTELMSRSLGEATTSALKKRMKDILNSRLPPEVNRYLDYGPEKFSEYASKIEENLPGKKFQELKNQILHTPLFVLPNGIFCGILAGAAAKHFSAAYKGPVVDPYELKRGIEVSRVMIWQAKNKEGFSVDLAMFLDAIKMLSKTFGVSLDKLGAIGKGIGKVNKAFKDLEERLNKLDGLIQGKIDEVRDGIDKVVGEIRGTLTDIQDTLFKPGIEAYKETKKFVEWANSEVLDAIPENIHGIPGNWEDFKDQFGIKPGIFGEAGELSPWDLLQKFAKDSGLLAAYEKFKKDMKRTADDINDAISGALATAGVEVVDAFGFTDQLAKAMSIEYVPEKDPSNKNPTDPVLLHNGEYYLQMIDLLIPGRGLHYEFRRTYRSRANFKGALGYNWSHNYEERLISDGSKIIHMDGEGRKSVFRRSVCPVVIASNAKQSRELDCFVANAPRNDSSSVILYMDGQYQLNTTDQSKTYFNSEGLMTSKESRSGSKLSFEYDEFKRLERVIDTEGRSIKYKYNSSGFLNEIEDFVGRTVQFKYSDDDDLVAVTGPKTFDFPKGKTIRYNYSSGYYEEGELKHNLTLVMDPKGQIFIRNQYSENDHVVSQKYGSIGFRIHIKYQRFRPAYLLRFIGKDVDLPVDQVTVSDRRGVIHIYQHNAFGNVLKEEYFDELGRRKKKEKQVVTQNRKPNQEKNKNSYEYDLLGNIVKETGENGKSTHYMVNALNQIVKETSESPIKHYKKYFFDENDNLVEVGIENRGGYNVAEIGKELVYSYKYDEMDNLTEKSEPVSKDKFIVTKFEYDPEGRVVREVFPEGNSVRYIYDAAGDLARVIRAAGSNVEQISSVKKSVTASKSNKKIVKYSSGDKIKHDSRGNVIQVLRPDGTRIQYDYDGLGRRLRSREFVNGEKWIVTHYEWDGNGRLTSLSDDKGDKTEYEYDALDRIVLERFPDGGIIKYKYDSRNNLTEIRDQAGTVVKQEYDSSSRLTYRKIERAEEVSGTTEQRFAYDDEGRLSYSRDNNNPSDLEDDAEVYYSYDPSSNLIGEIQNGKKVVRNFDKNDNVNVIKYPSKNVVHRKYDDEKNLTSLFFNGFKLATHQYEEKTEREPCLSPKSKLIYNKNGNLISDDKFQYIYDGLNRLVEVRRGDGSLLVRYGYDVHNRRVLKTQDTGPRTQDRLGFVYDGWDVVEEYEGEKLIRSFVHGDEIDSPVAMIDHLNDHKKYYYHQDVQRSVIAISNDSGEIVDQYKYNINGSIINAPERKNTGTPALIYTFTGRRLDPETGLIYFRNRYYSPDQGKFLTRDPLGYKTAQYSQVEGVTPFHLSFHRRRYLGTYPNTFDWLTGANEGVAKFNRFFRRPFKLDRNAETDLYSFAAGDTINGRDPLGLDYLWVTGEYRMHRGRNSSGRYADLDLIWIEEHEEGGIQRADISLPLYHGVSGPWGRGPLPSGDYRGHYIRKREHKGMSIGGFGWSLNIDPNFQTNRSLLRIHPDGNVFGSLGCIAIDEEGYVGLYDRLNSYINDHNEIDVHVRIREPGSESDDPLDRYTRNHVDILTSAP